MLFHWDYEQSLQGMDGFYGASRIVHNVLRIMMTEKQYWRFQICGMLLLILFFALPHLINAAREYPHALIRISSTDDGHYHARVKAALLGRYGEVRNGVTGTLHTAQELSPPAIGGPPALLELLVGVFFAWTRLHAPQVTMLLTIFLTPLIVTALASLLRALPLRREYALVGAFAYVIVFLGPLQKPVNMSLSLPLGILTMLLLLRAWQKPRLASALLAGIALGVQPAVYFWSWTSLWAMAGWLVLLHLFFVPAGAQKYRQTHALLLMWAVALLIASPSLLDLWLSSHGHPNFAETAFRSTIIHSRGVESVPRFLLLTALLLGSIVLAHGMRRETQRWLFAVAVIAGMYSAMYQNFLHGLIFTFSSHYYPFVCLTALIVGLWAYAHAPRSYVQIGVIGVASVFLLAGLWDYHTVWNAALRRSFVRDLQHLEPVLRTLDDGRRETVLTDKVSAHMITTWTDDDTVFTAYAKHLMISDREYAERYCLSEMFAGSGPDLHWLGSEVVETQDPARIAERARQFEIDCRLVSRDPRSYLWLYAVRWVLWNEKLRPDWTMDPRFITRVQQGDGWSLWRVRERMSW